MKYMFLVLLALQASPELMAQLDHRYFLKEDTVVLNESQYTWLLTGSSLYKNVKRDSAVQTVPQLLFSLASRKKIIFYDALTGQPVPAREIYTWQMPADTIKAIWAGENERFTVVQQTLNTPSFTSMRICQRLYLNTETGEMSATIQWAELLLNIYASEGSFIGVRPYFRIKYENEEAEHKTDH